MLERVFVRFSRTSVTASTASVTLKPASYAWRAVAYNARNGGHARENNLRDTFCLQLSFQVGVRKGAPGAFGDEDVVRLLMQFGDQFTEVGGSSRCRRGFSVLPGAVPATLTRTTGSFCLRKASIS
jgi:hypothetical protein